MPINKALWTPSFVLLTGGLGMATLAVCLTVFDLAGANSTAVQRVATAFRDGGRQRDIRLRRLGLCRRGR